MKNKIYQKRNTLSVKKLAKLSGLGMSILGILAGVYVFFPIISWEFYVKPVFASSTYAAPIPQNTIVTKDYLKNFISNPGEIISSINYSNSTNWMPNSTKSEDDNKEVSFYSITIPSVDLENAMVSTVDLDLESHLVHFPGTALPSKKGTAVIFGHSTLPQLYNRQDYKTIFANIHKTHVDDEIFVTVNNKVLKYKIFDIQIVNAEDISYLSQNYDDSYLYIVTCTPPGTIWKRLVIKTRLE